MAAYDASRREKEATDVRALDVAFQHAVRAYMGGDTHSPAARRTSALDAGVAAHGVGSSSRPPKPSLSIPAAAGGNIPTAAPRSTPETASPRPMAVEEFVTLRPRRHELRGAAQITTPPKGVYAAVGSTTGARRMGAPGTSVSGRAIVTPSVLHQVAAILSLPRASTATTSRSKPIRAARDTEAQLAKMQQKVAEERAARRTEVLEFMHRKRDASTAGSRAGTGSGSVTRRTASRSNSTSAGHRVDGTPRKPPVIVEPSAAPVQTREARSNRHGPWQPAPWVGVSDVSMEALYALQAVKRTTPVNREPRRMPPQPLTATVPSSGSALESSLTLLPHQVSPTSPAPGDINANNNCSTSNNGGSEGDDEDEVSLANSDTLRGYLRAASPPNQTSSAPYGTPPPDPEFARVDALQARVLTLQAQLASLDAAWRPRGILGEASVSDSLSAGDNSVYSGNFNPEDDDQSASNVEGAGDAHYQSGEHRHAPQQLHDDSACNDQSKEGVVVETRGVIKAVEAPHAADASRPPSPAQVLLPDLRTASSQLAAVVDDEDDNINATRHITGVDAASVLMSGRDSNCGGGSTSETDGCAQHESDVQTQADEFAHMRAPQPAFTAVESYIDDTGNAETHHFPVVATEEAEEDSLIHHIPARRGASFSVPSTGAHTDKVFAHVNSAAADAPPPPVPVSQASTPQSEIEQFLLSMRASAMEGQASTLPSTIATWRAGVSSDVYPHSTSQSPLQFQGADAPVTRSNTSSPQPALRPDYCVQSGVPKHKELRAAVATLVFPVYDMSTNPYKLPKPLNATKAASSNKVRAQELARVFKDGHSVFNALQRARTLPAKATHVPVAVPPPAPAASPVAATPLVHVPQSVKDARIGSQENMVHTADVKSPVVLAHTTAGSFSIASSEIAPPVVTPPSQAPGFTPANTTAQLQVDGSHTLRSRGAAIAEPPPTQFESRHGSASFPASQGTSVSGEQRPSRASTAVFQSEYSHTHSAPRFTPTELYLQFRASLEALEAADDAQVVLVALQAQQNEANMQRTMWLAAEQYQQQQEAATVAAQVSAIADDAQRSVEARTAAIQAEMERAYQAHVGAQTRAAEALAAELAVAQMRSTEMQTDDLAGRVFEIAVQTDASPTPPVMPPAPAYIHAPEPERMAREIAPLSTVEVVTRPHIAIPTSVSVSAATTVVTATAATSTTSTMTEPSVVMAYAPPVPISRIPPPRVPQPTLHLAVPVLPQSAAHEDSSASHYTEDFDEGTKSYVSDEVSIDASLDFRGQHLPPRGVPGYSRVLVDESVEDLFGHEGGLLAHSSASLGVEDETGALAARTHSPGIGQLIDAASVVSEGEGVALVTSPRLQGPVDESMPAYAYSVDQFESLSETGDDVSAAVEEPPARPPVPAQQLLPPAPPTAIHGFERSNSTLSLSSTLSEASRSVDASAILPRTGHLFRTFVSDLRSRLDTEASILASRSKALKGRTAAHLKALQQRIDQASVGVPTAEQQNVVSALKDQQSSIVLQYKVATAGLKREFATIKARHYRDMLRFKRDLNDDTEGVPGVASSLLDSTRFETEGITEQAATLPAPALQAVAAANSSGAIAELISLLVQAVRGVVATQPAGVGAGQSVGSGVLVGAPMLDASSYPPVAIAEMAAAVTVPSSTLSTLPPAQAAVQESVGEQSYSSDAFEEDQTGRSAMSVEFPPDDILDEVSVEVTQGEDAPLAVLLPSPLRTASEATPTRAASSIGGGGFPSLAASIRPSTPTGIPYAVALTATTIDSTHDLTGEESHHEGLEERSHNSYSEDFFASESVGTHAIAASAIEAAQRVSPVAVHAHAPSATAIPHADSPVADHASHLLPRTPEAAPAPAMAGGWLIGARSVRGSLPSPAAVHSMPVAEPEVASRTRVSPVPASAFVGRSTTHAGQLPQHLCEAVFEVPQTDVTTTDYDKEAMVDLVTDALLRELITKDLLTMLPGSPDASLRARAVALPVSDAAIRQPSLSPPSAEVTSSRSSGSSGSSSSSGSPGSAAQPISPRGPVYGKDDIFVVSPARGTSGSGGVGGGSMSSLGSPHSASSSFDAEEDLYDFSGAGQQQLTLPPPTTSGSGQSTPVAASSATTTATAVTPSGSTITAPVEVMSLSKVWLAGTSEYVSELLNSLPPVDLLHALCNAPSAPALDIATYLGLERSREARGSTPINAQEKEALQIRHKLIFDAVNEELHAFARTHQVAITRFQALAAVDAQSAAAAFGATLLGELKEELRAFVVRSARHTDAPLYELEGTQSIAKVDILSRLETHAAIARSGWMPEVQDERFVVTLIADELAQELLADLLTHERQGMLSHQL